MEQKIIALDVGGVCVQLHFDHFPQAMNMPCGDLDWEKSELWQMLVKEETMLEKGLLSTEDWFQVMNNVSKGKFSPAQLQKLWSDIIGDTVPGMDQAVRKVLATGEYRFVFFSNISLYHLQEVRRKCSFAHLISSGVYSCCAGSMKPEPEIYQAFEREYGKPYIYFDDREENIRQGLAQGWNAKLFTNPQSFLKDLTVLPR